MSKTSTDRARFALNGPTMGTRWSALLFAEPGFDTGAVQAALQAAVDEVDAQMSTWKPDSDLMRLNAAPVGEWVAAPKRLTEVLRLGLEIGRASGGAFDIGMGDAVTAWGFASEAAAPANIRAAMAASRRPAHEVLEMDGAHVRKSAAIALDLNGIAKGYGVDRLAQTVRYYGYRRRPRRDRWRDACARSAAGWRGVDHSGRGAGRRAPDAPFDPRSTGRRRSDLGQLPSLGRSSGKTPVAHHGPDPWRAAARFARFRHRRGPHLRRG